MSPPFRGSVDQVWLNWCGLDVAGEYVRKDIVEGEQGVSLFLDTQIIDIETCEPVQNIHVEIWRMCPQVFFQNVV